MKTLVIYYSLEGNTKLVAEKIAGTISADIISLAVSKKYPTDGFRKFMWGGKSVVFGEKPALLNTNIDLSLYDTIIIGTPIWAGTYAPPIKTFLSQYKITNKNVALFVCHSGGGAEKCFKKIHDAIPDNNFIGEIDFIDPAKNPESNSDIAVKWAESLLLKIN